MFQFRPGPKLGKKKRTSKEDLSCSESYRSNKEHTQFVYISSDEAIFPGFYSWWGIQPIQHIDPPHNVLFAEYLKKTPDSPYGNHAFLCNFEKVLSAYAESRKLDIGNICIRKGGTLRYIYEICYVLIVCSGADDDDLSEFEPIRTELEQFRMNGLIDNTGKIINVSAIPTFHPKYIVAQARDIKYSYEAATFAFYFPTQTEELCIDKSQCTHEIVEHSRQNCLKTIFPSGHKTSICPNEASEVD